MGQHEILPENNHQIVTVRERSPVIYSWHVTLYVQSIWPFCILTLLPFLQDPLLWWKMKKEMVMELGSLKWQKIITGLCQTQYLLRLSCGRSMSSLEKKNTHLHTWHLVKARLEKWLFIFWTHRVDRLTWSFTHQVVHRQGCTKKNTIHLEAHILKKVQMAAKISTPGWGCTLNLNPVTTINQQTTESTDDFLRKVSNFLSHCDICMTNFSYLSVILPELNVLSFNIEKYRGHTADIDRFSHNWCDEWPCLLIQVFTAYVMAYFYTNVMYWTVFLMPKWCTCTVFILLSFSEGFCL